MSRQLRHLGRYPSSEVAQLIWQALSTLDDVREIAEVTKAVRATRPNAEAALVKKLLVELASFDKLVPAELHRLLRTETGELSHEDRHRLGAALKEYHPVFGSKRRLLKQIRDTLGVHRRAFPSDADRAGLESTFAAWGAWEHRLVEMEAFCTLEHWIEPINAAFALGRALSVPLLGAWYSMTEKTIRLWLPLRVEWGPE